VAAGAAVLLYAGLTAHVWEDYWITFRSSRNLAEGHGLVYQPGERVHTFTSPLGVLLPAAGHALLGHDLAALWAFRIVSALAVAGATLLLLAHAREQRWPGPALAVGLALGIFEAKVIAFSANGMETGLLLLFSALTWRELFRTGGLRPGWLALGYAGLMWTRPDAFIVAGAMTLGRILFHRPAHEAGPAAARRLGGAIALGGLLYAPWFFWAWSYYGSPVPQTILAKAAFLPGDWSLARIALAPLRCLVGPTGLDGLYAPTYFQAEAWPASLVAVARGLARVAAFAWLIPGLARPARAASFATLVGGSYLSLILPYPWYYAPWTFLGAVAWAGLLELGLHARFRLGPSLARIGSLALPAFAAGLLVVLTVHGWYQQRLTEDLGRKPIGLWLKAQARPGDRVFLEPLGYIGYHSQLKMLDFPGLSAPEVSDLVRAGHRSYAELIRRLRPEWLVIRGHEYLDEKLAEGDTLQPYELVLVSDRREPVAAVPFLPGRRLLEYDAMFLVYHRRDHVPPPPAQP